MKKITKFCVFCLAISAITLLFSVSHSVNAETGGGQVSTISGINFLEGDADSDSTPTEPLKEDSEKVPNKSGFLPKTGETNTTYFIVVLGLSLITLLIMTFFKRSKRYEK